MTYEPQNVIENINKRILVVDDDPDSLQLILRPLNWEGYDVKSTDSVEKIIELIDSFDPHVVLLDKNINGHNGLETLKKIREKQAHLPCIIISGDAEIESITQGLDAGADDYVVKPFVDAELLARIRVHLRISDLLKQLREANAKLQELVDIDDLTGLYNMRSLYQRLEYEIQRGQRFGRETCVVMMDMDRFKMVNDGHDHLFGSFVISEVGKIIKACTRNIDIPARYGGDEFLIVLTETSPAGAEIFCERLRQKIKGTTFVNGQDSISLTVSIGYAIAVPTEEIDAQSLVRRADHALYDAKRSGRDRVCAHHSSEVDNVISLNEPRIKHGEEKKMTKKRKLG